MEKRNFLKLSSLAATGLLFANSAKLKADNRPAKIKPQALKAGDTVRIIAPGSAVSDPDDFQKANEIISSMGLVPVYSKYLMTGSGYKTRTVKERINDLHEAFGDKSAKAVFSIRGGYGAGQLVDSIDYSLIRNNPKIFCGFSDITALHTAISVMTGLVTFHSPVLLSPYTPYTQDIFIRMLFSTEVFGVIGNPASKYGLRSSYPVRTINQGVSEGELTGGNLSLVSSLVGTKYQINSKKKILVLEDVGEPPYRIDRMMNQLRLAGILEDASGIVFGRCNDCNSDSNQSTWDFSLGEVLDFYLKPLGKPAFYGLMIGHTSEQATLPLGCNSRLNADNGTIEILENCVI
ncbi:MAG: LD-carboxypeptidase [Candidatus Kapabacteria bacterium]|nr:LD-carboxypeptidase [Candidatus Kapabacteria bacterium]